MKQQQQRRLQQTLTKLKADSEKINKIDKPLARLIKKKKGEESNQQNQKLKWRKHNRQHRNAKGS